MPLSLAKIGSKAHGFRSTKKFGRGEGTTLFRWLRAKNTHLMEWIANTAGMSITFWAFVLWYATWIAWNTFAPPSWRFDPYPYSFLLFLSNTLQLWYLPVITLQSMLFNRWLTRLLEEIRTLADQMHQIQGRQQYQIDQLHTMMGAQKHMIDATITILETQQTILQHLTNKVEEIDAEIDAWGEAPSGSKDI